MDNAPHEVLHWNNAKAWFCSSAFFIKLNEILTMWIKPMFETRTGLIIWNISSS